jgi:NifU-like protein
MWNYTEKVVDHFLHPRNVGEVENADGTGEVGSLACGDMLKFTFKLDADDRITDAQFKTFGCASAIASSSALTELVKGKTLDEALRITNKDIADFLGGLPEEKMHCSVMGREALEAAISDYRGEANSVRELEGEITCKCFGVTEKEIRHVINENNLNSVEDVTNYTKAGGACGECQDEIRKLLAEENSDVSLENNASDHDEESGYTNLKRMHMIEDLISERIRPALKQDGGDIELVDIDRNLVRVRLKGACATCPSSGLTMRRFIEKEIQKTISGAIRVEEVRQ